MTINFSPYSNYGYFSLRKQSGDTVILPNTPIRITSESLLPSYGKQDINEVAGDRERYIRAIQGLVEFGGDVEFFVEEKQIGHFFTALLGTPTSQDVFGDGTAYRHVWEVEDDDNIYTFDIQPGDAPWKHRFSSVHVSQIELAREDNAIKCTISVMPTKGFITARVTSAVNSGTTLPVDQTTGLTTSDTLLILSRETGYTTLKELTISSIDSETQLTTSTIDVQLDADDIVVLKTSVVNDTDYDQCVPLQFANGMAFYTGTDIDNTTEEKIEDFTITLQNELEARYASGDNEVSRMPNEVYMKGYMSSGQVTKTYNNESYIDKLRANAQFGARFRFNSHEVVTANIAQKAKTTWGANGFYIEASTAGRAGNDYNVTIVINDTDDLAASISGKNILIELANATASKNTGTLIASAVNALSGVDAVANGTGATQFTSAEPNVNLGHAVGTSGSTATVDQVGADASQRAYLQLDFSCARIEPFFVNNEEDNLITQEIPFKFYKDVDCADDQRKNWSGKVFLYNSKASY